MRPTAKSDGKRGWLVTAGAATLVGVILGLAMVVFWPENPPAVAPSAPVAFVDAGEDSAAPVALADEGCVVPFLDVNPDVQLPETRRLCDAKDAKACTRLGFICDQTVWARYPRGVLPSRALDSLTCATLRMSGNVRQACSRAGSKGRWFGVACDMGNWLACIQPPDPSEREKSGRSDDERRGIAERQCGRNQVAACAELAMPALTKNGELRAAYERITSELVACRGDAGTRCAPSAEARVALGRAKVIAGREALETALRAGRVDAAMIEELKRGCDARDDAAACFDLARASKEESRGSSAMVRACQLGSLDACLSLQSLYLVGAGGLPGYSGAVGMLRRSFELACRRACGEDHCSAACRRLAADVFAASPASLDLDAARAACQEEGNPDRCMEVARSLAAGTGDTPPDPAGASEFRTQATAIWNGSCSRGTGPSCLALARLLGTGPAATRDFGGAANAAKRGCNDAHDRASCLMLARMYERGEGVGKDATRSKRCLDAAMDFGRPAACP